MALKLVCTLLPVLCVSFILQLATCFSVFQSTTQQYHQTTHSSGGASEPDNQTSASKDFHQITDSSSAKYGFPGVTKIKEFIEANPSGKVMTESHKNNGVMKRTSTFGRSNSETVSTYLLKIQSGNNNLLTTLQTDNREIIHLQDKPSNTSKQRLAQASTRQKQNRKRKRDIGLLYLFPETLKDSGKSIHLRGNQDNASEDKRNRTHKSRLYLFSNSTLVNIPLYQETNSQSRTSKTAKGASRENKTKKTGLPRKINNYESNYLDNVQNFKKNLYDQFLISKLPTVQNKRRQSALIFTLDKNQNKNGLVSHLDKPYGANRSADFWRLEKAHKHLSERSAVKRKQELKRSSLNLVQSDTDDEGTVKKLSDSDKQPWSEGVMKKTSPAFTDLDSSNFSSKIEKKYILKPRKADREKRTRSIFSNTKINDEPFTRNSYFPERSGRIFGTDELARTFHDYPVLRKGEPDDKLLDFIINSNRIKPEDFNIHTFTRRRRAATGRSTRERLPQRSDDYGEENVTPALPRQTTSWEHPYIYIPGFTYDEDIRATSHGTVNTGMDNINFRISDDLFRAHIENAIDKID